MNKILNYFSKKESKPKQTLAALKKPKVLNKSQNAEFEKITNYHYQSKFTSINDKVHEKLSPKFIKDNQNTSSGNLDIEEMEVFRLIKNNVEDSMKIELTKFDIFILSFICFCVEFGFFFI